MNRVPTERQYRLLAAIGATAIALAPGRGEWGPLLRREWVETLGEDDKDKRYLPPLRITPEGLRAMALAMERYDVAPEIRAASPRQVNEPPTVTRLKAELVDARDERDAARREAQALRSTLMRVRAAAGLNGSGAFEVAR